MHSQIRNLRPREHTASEDWGRQASKVLRPGRAPFHAAQALLPVASGGSHLTLAGTATSVVKSPPPLPYSKFLKVQTASLSPLWPLQLLLGTGKRLCKC